MTLSLEWPPGERRWREVRGPTMRPPSRLRTRVALVVVAAAVGFLVGVQARESRERAGRLAAESAEDLTRILAELNAEADRLAREISSLRVKEAEYRSSATREEVLLEDAREALADLRVLAGSVPVRGPGVRITLSDPEGALTWDVLLDVVQELRDAGTEAVAVGGVRVGASTWFGPAEGGVAVDGETVGSPYGIDAIGPAEGLRVALEIPGGPLSVLGAQPGVGIRVEVRDEMRLPALHREIVFRYARPA